MAYNSIVEVGISIPIPLLFRWVGVSILVMTPSVGLAQMEKHKPSPQPTVVFVCEHGAAKSVVAAAWFNKLAAEQHLPFHAIARGIAPQKELSESAVAGLQRDGVAFPSNKPLPLTDSDASNTVRLVALGPLPASMKLSHVDSFDVPAPNDGYDQSRDAILLHVKALLKELQGHPR